jgi:hypothetical protein
MVVTQHPVNILSTTTVDPLGPLLHPFSHAGASAASLSPIHSPRAVQGSEGHRQRRALSNFVQFRSAEFCP